MSRFGIVTLAFALAVSSSHAAVPDRPARLEDLVRRAEKHSPGLQASRQRIAAAQALLSEATVSPFTQWRATGSLGIAPNVRGTAVYSDANSQIGLGDDRGWNLLAGADVRGTVPLYTWGKIRHARAAAKEGVRGAELDRERVRARLRFDVRRAYFGLQFALDVLQLISEGKGKLEKAAKKLRQRLEAGDDDVEREDVWRISSTLAEIRAQQAEAERLERSARAALRTLTGLPEVRVPDCPSETAALKLKPLSWYQQAARLHRPDGRMLDSALRARELSRKIERASYFPDLGLVFQVGQTVAPGRTDQNNPFIIDGWNYSTLAAGIAARWSLDFAGTYYRVQRRSAQLAELRAQQRLAHDGISLEVTDAYTDAVAARAAERAWAEGHRDTRSWFVSATQAYQVGANETRDLIEAVKAYFKARGAHLESIRRFNTAAARLELATGSRVIQSNKDWESRCAYE